MQWVEAIDEPIAPITTIIRNPGSPLGPAIRNQIDWGEAPAVTMLYGRRNELDHLHDWISNARCRMVTLVGMGGIGKTVLAVRLTHQLASQFDYVIWRSLLNAPPLADILRLWLQFLSNQQLTEWPTSRDEQFALLFGYLRQQRCLFVLDNVESILQGGDRTGVYRAGYEEYGHLLLRMGESAHQSCLLLTSRERPREVTRLEAENGFVRVFALDGLDAHIGRELLGAYGVAGAARSAATLVARYSGNPLALKLLAETIVDFFDGNIDLFLREETLIFDDIRDVLDQHFARLTPLERTIILWLAIEREECTLQRLHSSLWPAPAKRDLLEALRSLQQRSLLDKTGRGLALQNVVTEYAIDYLIEQVSREITLTTPVLLKSYSLLKAQAKDYVRQSQQRLILQPLGERLLAELGPAGLTAKLKALLSVLRTTTSPGMDYGGSNILHLLLHWGLQAGIDAQGYDFSQLTIRQAYLQGVCLPAINFAHAHWSESIFTNTFGNVTTVAFSPDGQYLAAGSSDGAIRLWRVTDGQLAMILTGHQRFVWSVVFSPDNSCVISGSADHTVRIWDLKNGYLLRTLQDHGNVVYTVALHPNGTLLASSGDSTMIQLSDVHSGSPVRMLPSPTPLYSVVFHPITNLLAGAGHDGIIRLWDIVTGELVHTLTGHQAPIWRLAFSPDGAWLASSSYDHTVRIWDMSAMRLRSTLRAHALEVDALAFSPDGAWLASGSWDKTVRLWDLASEQTIQTLYGHTDWISELAFSPDGTLLASGGWDKSVRLWDVGKRQSAVGLGAARHTFLGFVSSIYSVAFSPVPVGQSVLLASGGEDQQVQLWDLNSGQTVHTLEGHTAPIYAIAFHPQGKLLASAGNDQMIRVWNSQTGKTTQILEGHSNSIKSLAFSPCATDELLVSASKDQTLRLWDLRQGRTLQILQGHTATVAAVAFHPGGDLIASGSYDHTVRLWDRATGHARHCLVGHTNWVYSVAFSPDGRTLASAGYDKTIRLWNVDTGELRSIIQGHTDYVYAVAFSPDGSTLASSSTDQTVRVWDAQTGLLRHTLTGHTNWVWSLAFSPTNGLLASGSVDQTIKLWDWSSGLCQQTLHPVGPYAGMNITGAKGLTDAQKAALKVLGAREEA